MFYYVNTTFIAPAMTGNFNSKVMLSGRQSIKIAMVFPVIVYAFYTEPKRR